MGDGRFNAKVYQCYALSGGCPIREGFVKDIGPFLLDEFQGGGHLVCPVQGEANMDP
jgi:hypothetical protein